MTTINLLMVGYGNVGKAFGIMLEKKLKDLHDHYDVDVKIVGIVTRSKGVLINDAGIDVSKLNEYSFDNNSSAMEAIETAKYDILVELTPINIQTGMPAIAHIETALKQGKNVITANKGPVAWAYRRLKKLASENNVCFRHEATVMDGIPIFNLYQETLMECKITEIKGILNATTNYILEEMEKGVSFEEAIIEGKRRGFVEADPSMDVEGWDASAKLTALMNVLMDEEITPIEINRKGISQITQEMIKTAAESGKKYKLLCHGYIEDGKAKGVVEPTLIDKNDMLASINGTAAAVTLTTDLMGEVSIVEHVYVPEIDQTAYGVLNDLVRIIKERY